MQVDEGGGEALRRLIEKLGVERAHLHRHREGARRRRRHASNRMDFADGSHLPVDLVVFATGVRPRDELARDAGLRGRRARRRRGRRGCCRDRPAAGRLRDRRGRLHRGPHLGPGRAGLHDGRGRRRPAARRGGHLPRRRHLHQAQAPRRRRRQLRRRVRASHPARSRSCTPTRWPASTRSSSSPTTPRRCSVACSSATRAAYAPCGRWSASRSAPTRPPGCCPRARQRRPTGDLPDAAHVCSCNNVDAGHRSGAPVTERRLHRPRRRQGVHQGRHLAAARACRWSRSWSTTELEKTGVTVSNALCEHFELSPRPAVRRRPRPGARARSARSSTRHGTRSRLRHLPARGRLDPGRARHAVTCSTATRRGCRTPTTT